MREGWSVRPLAEVCEIKPPKREVRNRLEADDPVSFVPMNDLGIREKWPLPKEERPLASVAGSYTYFADGDVLLAKITPCFENGKLGIARGLTNGVGFGSSEFVVLRPSEALDAEFLFYFLSQDSFRDAGVRVMSGAVGHKRVPNEFIRKTAVPLPPLPEQKRIVAILDEAFAGIATAVANTERNLANARELFESYLDAVFARQWWSVETVGEVCESIIDCVNKTAPTTNVETSFKMIRTTNVRDGRIDLSSVKYVSEKIFQTWTRRQTPRRGDVILTREAPLGEVGLIDTDDKLFLGQRLVSYRTDPMRLNNLFLLYAFQSQFMQNQIRSLASGSTVQHMRVPDSKKLTLPVPSIHEQMSAVEDLDSLRAKTDEIAVIYQRKLSALSELKQSLLQKAFSGELTAGREASDAILKEEQVA